MAEKKEQVHTQDLFFFQLNEQKKCFSLFLLRLRARNCDGF